MAVTLAKGELGTRNTWINNCSQGSAGGTYYFTTIYGGYSRTEDQEEANKSTLYITVVITADKTYTTTGRWIGRLTGEFTNSWDVRASVNSNSMPAVLTVSKEVTHDENGNWSGYIGATGCDGPPSNSVSSTISSTQIVIPQIDRTVTLSDVSVISSTSTTAEVTWTANKVCKLVEYQVNGGNWIEVGNPAASSGTFTATGLTEGAENIINVRVTRSASGKTTTKDVTVKTLAPNRAEKKLKINGEWRRGKSMIKINSQWKDATTFNKVNGVWKQAIN